MNSVEFELGSAALNATTSIGTGGAGSVISERKVQEEMSRNGMSIAPSNGLSADRPSEGFGGFLERSIQDVNKAQVEADSAMKELVAGRTKNIHETLLAVERADTSLKLMMQVRNKILDAYREIIRMQV